MKGVIRRRRARREPVVRLRYAGGKTVTLEPADAVAERALAAARRLLLASQSEIRS